MTGIVKINRARRNLLKIAGTAAVAIVGAMAPARAGGGDDEGESGGGRCFLRGTQIRTPNGYCAIETLKADDKVATRFAGFAPIKAVDGFTLNPLGGEWVGASRPVRIQRNSLGEKMPAQDLCLTAAHAIVIDDVLVPIVNLVNGTTIVFETAQCHDTLDFFHIELAKHDVLDVQGAACESLLRPSAEPCLPMMSFNGGLSQLRSRLRSVLSLAVDRRQPLDVIRDTIEERGRALARAA
jgi:Hint domain